MVTTRYIGEHIDCNTSIWNYSKPRLIRMNEMSPVKSALEAYLWFKYTKTDGFLFPIHNSPRAAYLTCSDSNAKVTYVYIASACNLHGDLENSVYITLFQRFLSNTISSIAQVWTASTLALVMACRVRAPNHQPNQCWLTMCKALWRSSEASFRKDN